MFSLFARRKASPSTRARTSPRTRLSLESLDARALLSGVTPVIDNYQAEQLSNGVFCIHGHVSDDHPGGLTVTFGGGLGGINGQTAVTDSDGAFSIIVTVTDYESGRATATTIDSDGNSAAQVSVPINPTPPPDETGDGGGPIGEP